MKKIICTVLAVIAMLFTGCKKEPTPETVNSTANAIGVSVAMVLNTTKISDANRNVIVEISNVIDSAVKQTNSTFEATWTPIAQAYVTKLIQEKKIDDAAGKVIVAAFSTGAKTLDWAVTAKWPKIGEKLELVEAATHGFFAGFLKYFKPVNGVVATPAAAEYDKGAYEYMLKLQKK